MSSYTRGVRTTCHKCLLGKLRALTGDGGATSMTEATFIGPMLTALGLEAGLLTMSMYTICLEKDGLGLLSFYTLMKISKEVQPLSLPLPLKNSGLWQQLECGQGWDLSFVFLTVILQEV